MAPRKRLQVVISGAPPIPCKEAGSSQGHWLKLRAQLFAFLGEGNPGTAGYKSPGVKPGTPTQESAVTKGPCIYSPFSALDG